MSPRLAFHRPAQDPIGQSITLQQSTSDNNAGGTSIERLGSRSDPSSPNRVLILCAGYFPGYRRGGPGRSIAGMVQVLGEGLAFSIITEDRDRGDEQPYPDVDVKSWNVLGTSRVRYIPMGWFDFARILRVITVERHDVLYANSFFDPRFSIIPVLARKISTQSKSGLLIAPRGEFSPGALELKAWRKRIYIALARAAGIYNDATWHASTPHEAADIRRVMGPAAHVIVARNISSVAAAEGAVPSSSVEQAAGPRLLRLCFLSRLSRKKNLKFLLEVLTGCRVPAALDIYGPVEDAAYWRECEAVMAKLPPAVTARYCGVVPHDQVQQTLARYDLFCLPTLGENFGHVFLESWAAGVPVLISDQTPWRDLGRQQLGMEVPLDRPEQYGAFIEQVASWSPAERRAVRQRCVAHALAQAQDPDVIRANREMFIAVAARRPGGTA